MDHLHPRIDDGRGLGSGEGWRGDPIVPAEAIFGTTAPPPVLILPTVALQTGLQQPESLVVGADNVVRRCLQSIRSGAHLQERITAADAVISTVEIVRSRNLPAIRARVISVAPVLGVMRRRGGESCYILLLQIRPLPSDNKLPDRYRRNSATIVDDAAEEVGVVVVAAAVAGKNRR